MLNILILGAGGQIARVATQLFLQKPDVQLTLYLRRADCLKHLAGNARVRIIEGDVLDAKRLVEAMAGQDVVYANLDGALDAQAKEIIRAMKQAGLRRLIFISSMGIYGEVPGEQYRSILNPYRDSAKEIEASGLDYTVIRPSWLNDKDEVAYGTTTRDEPFRNATDTVSRKSVADLVVKLATTPGLHVGSSLGVHHES